MKMNEHMFILILILSFSSYLTSNIFDIQETVTILCRQFPMISDINDTSLQCARLRIDSSVSTGDFNLQAPTSINLFTIVDIPFSSSYFNDITIRFDRSPDLPSSIVDIRLSLLVTYGQYTVNNQSTSIYNASSITVLHWRNGTLHVVDVIDVILVGGFRYENDSSLCKWNIQIWNRLFQDEQRPNSPPYSYFLKTNSQQLRFTLIGTTDATTLPAPPTPFLSVLYCIPFTMEPTEIVLIAIFSFIVLVSLVGGCVWHWFRKDYDKPPRYAHRHPSQTTDPSSKSGEQGVRHRSSASVTASASESNDQTID